MRMRAHVRMCVCVCVCVCECVCVCVCVLVNGQTFLLFMKNNLKTLGELLARIKNDIDKRVNRTLATLRSSDNLYHLLQLVHRQLFQIPNFVRETGTFGFSFWRSLWPSLWFQHLFLLWTPPLTLSSGLRIRWLYPIQRSKIPSPPKTKTVYTGYDTASDGKILFLEIWGLWCTNSLTSHPDQHWPRAIVAIRVPSRDEIDLYKIYSYSTGPCVIRK